ncbi:hypothetical protein CK218_29510 [Mesorhizobium sp. WSM3879]|nr:hypothetical protein CK218_29510 [Mesorhizobium sp. WSM3879]
MKTLKQAEVAGLAYRDAPDMRRRIASFIEDVYNRQRLHSALDYLSLAVCVPERPLPSRKSTRMPLLMAVRSGYGSFRSCESLLGAVDTFHWRQLA